MSTQYLIKWDRKPILNQTWIQMKVGFCAVVKELERTGSLQVTNMHAIFVQDIVLGIQKAIQPTIDAVILVSSPLLPPFACPHGSLQ